jgi:hypothetical protein
VHDFERLELLRRVLGLTSTRATRDWLASDRARKTRRLFLLDRVRPHFGGPARVLLENVPSEKTMSNYRKCFPEADRAAAYKAFFERFFSDEGFRNDLIAGVGEEFHRRSGGDELAA